mgnify:FL=1
MSKIIFLRRQRLGYDSVRGISAFINNQDDDVNIIELGRSLGGGNVYDRAGHVRNDFMERMPDYSKDDFLVRWGCTSRTENWTLDQQINPSKAISETSNKGVFRMKCYNSGQDIVPISFCTQVHATKIMMDQPVGTKWVVRSGVHSQGRNLWVVNNYKELVDVLYENQLDSWYASMYIPKVAEYRVYFVEGRVVKVDKKIPDDEEAVAWNCHNGGKFVNVKWDKWPLNVIEVAHKSFLQSSLDFGGVDIMVDKNDKAYMLEINSAPSVTFRADGKVSYSQKCMAKAFDYIRVNGKGTVPTILTYESWKHTIHPAISDKFL